MSIYADCESKRRARKKWRQGEKGKAWDKAYSQRDYVKAKAHEYYLKQKIKHAENDTLNSLNSEGFVNYVR